MNNKTKLIAIIFACVVLFGLAILAYTLLSSNYGTQTVADKDDAKAHIENSTVSSNKADANSEQKSEYAAPDFQVTDKDGNIVKLSDFSGKPVVINFFTSWCQPCRNEMPYFEEMYRENDDVVFMMINVTYDDDKPADWKSPLIFGSCFIALGIGGFFLLRLFVKTNRKKQKKRDEKIQRKYGKIVK